MNATYQVALRLYSKAGIPLGQVSVDPDWEPARECTLFDALRKGVLTPAEMGTATTVEPLWHPSTGAPMLQGFRVCVPGHTEARHDFPVSYLKSWAQQAVMLLVKEGKLAVGEPFDYVAMAFPRGEGGSPQRRSLEVQEVAPVLPVKQSCLQNFQAVAVPAGRDDWDEQDWPVFLPQQALKEASALAQAAGVQETGGVLIGHLRHDPTVPESFVEVTTQVPAQHTEATSTKLTFTAQTWTQVRSILELRSKNELLLGWWHSHPVKEYCSKCPLEAQKECKLAAGFLSEDDRALHRAVFSRAYNLALVVNVVSFSEPTMSLFGWRHGLLEARNFQVI